MIVETLCIRDENKNQSPKRIQLRFRETGKRDQNGSCWFHKHPQNPTSMPHCGISLLRMTDGPECANAKAVSKDYNLFAFKLQ